MATYKLLYSAISGIQDPVMAIYEPPTRQTTYPHVRCRAGVCVNRAGDDFGGAGEEFVRAAVAVFEHVHGA